MKKYRLQKIGIKSLAKIYLIFGFIFSLLFVLLYSIPMLAEYGWSRTFFFLLPLIIFYPLFMVLFAVIATWLYNLIAGKIGGVEIYLKEDVLLAPAPIDNDADNIVT